MTLLCGHISIYIYIFIFIKPILHTRSKKIIGHFCLRHGGDFSPVHTQKDGFQTYGLGSMLIEVSAFTEGKVY